MIKNTSVLAVDDNKDILFSLKMALKTEFEEVIAIQNPDLILEHLQNTKIDIIILDMNFVAGINTGNEGFYWLNRIKEFSKNTEVVLMTAYGNIELAVKAMKQGASDFILKPWDNAKLIHTLKCLLEKKKTDVKKNKSEKETNTSSDADTILYCSSEKMQNVYKMISKIAETDANVLILGENGSGKELIAREIHRKSNRRDKVFQSVDMGAISETLFESELFGHIRGSFTDAKEDRIGKFEAANKGTLFLDEIGNLSFTSQAKLLAALQNKQITKLGSNSVVNVDIRLICATNKKLKQMVAEGTFREDLFFRINTIVLEIPPLRERPEDIEALAKHFIKMYEGKYRRQGLSFTKETVVYLRNYQWPGNIRELSHCIEKAVIFSTNNEVLTCDSFSFEDFTKSYSDTTIIDSLNLEDAEKNIISLAMKKHAGNISAAATELGVTRKTLYAKLEKYGI